MTYTTTQTDVFINSYSAILLSLKFSHTYLCDLLISLLHLDFKDFRRGNDNLFYP